MGFTNPDGSALVGGLNPAGVGQSLNLDALGDLFVTDAVRAAALKGNAYLASNGLVNAAAGSYPMGLFNPANSGKNIFIYSISVSCGGTGFDTAIKLVTSNPAFSKTAVVNNKKIGGAASVIASSITYENTSQTMSAAPFLKWEPYTKSPVDAIAANSPLLLPAGAANGIIVWLSTYGAGYSAVHIEWIEF